MKLCNYRMTNDSGFAPHIQDGILTLATCKPVLRRTMKVGEWIAGWYSKTLFYKYQKECRDAHQSVPQEYSDKLIYLAKISKIVTYQEYWDNYQGRCYSPENKNGDNIYRAEPKGGPIVQDPGFKVEKTHDTPEEQKRDIGGENVLICDEYYYFGHEEKALEVKQNDYPPKTRSHKIAYDGKAQELIEIVRALDDSKYKEHRRGPTK